MPYRPYKKNIPLSQLKPDPEGAGMLDAPQTQIYDRIIMAAMQGQDPSAAIRELTAVPVEERYISRVIAALGFAFGDFDSACVRMDLDTLPPAEIERLTALLAGRSTQFCILMREFFGSEQMKAIISAAAEGPVETTDGFHAPQDLAA
jgi:hypothetical protein